MYSIKQNQLLMGALPVAEITVHYMDIRAPGKRYDEFYEQAKAMGATYIKGRVAAVTEQPNGDLVLTYEDIENGGAVTKAEYDLVVLAVGVQPNRDAEPSTTGSTSRNRRRTSTRVPPASPASSWPVPRRAPRTSRTPSSTRAPRPPRSPPTSSARSRPCRRS
jgi:heterodisulfide reductase subunit A-like polyferredoxin